jgi:polyvinyl alcohol dehydrogenase (cytochrome)
VIRNRRSNVYAAFATIVGMTSLSGFVVGADAIAQTPSQTSVRNVDGAAIYGQRCAACHDNATDRTPTRAMLRTIQPEGIVGALTEGAMRLQASGMTLDEMNAVAAFVSGKPLTGAQAALTHPNTCKTTAPLAADAKVHWNGWGRDLSNTRYQPTPGLAAADVPKLKLKWAYAYSGRFAQGQPTLLGDRLFVSNTDGEVSLLDAHTGCEHWMFKGETSIKTAVSIGTVRIGNSNKQLAFFGDERARAYAVDVSNGTLVWSTVLETHAAARTVGSPAFHDGRLYVPMSSAEESASLNLKYSCCTFRGSLSALDAATGKVLWKSYPITQEPKPMKISTAGTQMFGPAGAAIWSAPTIDTKRGLIYVATGNSYTDADTDGSDAIVAFDLATGARRWVNQVHPDDNFIIGCGDKNRGVGNCPEDGGPDFDFGASPILQSLPNGKQIILAGQKSGAVYALDPDDQGKLLWKQQVGRGSALGGVEWGPATDNKNIYVAISDAGAGKEGKPGLTALDLVDGTQRWHVPTPVVECSWGKSMCARGQPGAVTVIPGGVFSGALDGHLRAYDANDGKILWDVDTGKSIAVVNGPDTPGGSIDSGGITIANGMLFLTSGYGRWGKAGRLLLVFTVDGK